MYFVGFVRGAFFSHCVRCVVRRTAIHFVGMKSNKTIHRFISAGLRLLRTHTQPKTPRIQSCFCCPFFRCVSSKRFHSHNRFRMCVPVAVFGVAVCMCMLIVQANEKNHREIQRKKNSNSSEIQFRVKKKKQYEGNMNLNPSGSRAACIVHERCSRHRDLLLDRHAYTHSLTPESDRRGHRYTAISSMVEQLL